MHLTSYAKVLRQQEPFFCAFAYNGDRYGNTKLFTSSRLCAW